MGMLMQEQLEKISQWKKVNLTINQSECNNNRTYLYVNESLRLAVFQIYYNKSIITTAGNIVQIPSKYIPVVALI